VNGDALKKAFKESADMRQLRTPALVKGARLQGEMRVAVGGEDETRDGWNDREGVRAKWEGL
jgi:salicylate hydroxylase